MTHHPSCGSDRGFSLIETVVAMMLLTFCLMTLAQVFVLGMSHMSTSSYDIIAREKAREAVESVHTARDTRIITWAQIRNVANGGVFLDGARPLRGVPGNEGDGLVNTADDNGLPMQSIVAPGPDQVLGTGDDVSTPLTTFTRELEIRDIAGSPALRQLRVIIRYRVGNQTRTYTLTTFVSSFS
jgi:prepilin-type N-terminal cleavage/methylation domain-containing protein